MTHSYMDIAQDLAKKAGVIMRKNFTRNMKKEWKGERSPVTETDIEINALILKEVKENFPEHSIIAEEESARNHESEYEWICDPVDGTHNFSHGIPTATFALGLVHDGLPILGVVYDPFLDRLWSAEKGKGAYLNGERINVSKNSSLKRSLVSMGKMKDVRNFYPVLEALREAGAMGITGLSIHYTNALVASGEFVASFFGGRTVHDITQSTIIVTEAGGMATDVFGDIPLRYDEEMAGQLVSNGLLHKELLEIMDRVSPRT